MEEVTNTAETKIVLPEGTTEFTLFHGERNIPNEREQKHSDFAGTIDAPAKYLDHRIKAKLIDKAQCLVVYNKHAGQIELTTSETDPYAHTVVGEVKVNLDVGVFRINTGQRVDNHDLRDIIRFNRRFFKDEAQAAKLLKKMQDFKAKANVTIESENDLRGKAAESKTVDIKISDMAKEDGLEFVLNMPLYANSKPVPFVVEMIPVLVGKSVEFVLQSPELKAAQDAEREFMVDGEIEAIIELGVCCIQVG